MTHRIILYDTGIRDRSFGEDPDRHITNVTTPTHTRETPSSVTRLPARLPRERHLIHE